MHKKHPKPCLQSVFSITSPARWDERTFPAYSLTLPELLCTTFIISKAVILLRNQSNWVSAPRTIKRWAPSKRGSMSLTGPWGQTVPTAEATGETQQVILVLFWHLVSNPIREGWLNKENNTRQKLRSEIKNKKKAMLLPNSTWRRKKNKLLQADNRLVVTREAVNWMVTAELDVRWWARCSAYSGRFIMSHTRNRMLPTHATAIKKWIKK